MDSNEFHADDDVDLNGIRVHAVAASFPRDLALHSNGSACGGFHPREWSPIEWNPRPCGDCGDSILERRLHPQEWSRSREPVSSLSITFFRRRTFALPPTVWRVSVSTRAMSAKSSDWMKESCFLGDDRSSFLLYVPFRLSIGRTFGDAVGRVLTQTLLLCCLS